MTHGWETTPIEVLIPNGLYDEWIATELTTFQAQNRRAPSSPVTGDFSECAWVALPDRR
jgi:hypothetical protein